MMFNPTNIFANVPASSADELCTTLVDSPHVRIERIVSCGHASPEGFWYDQPHDEWVVVLQGAARLTVGDRVVDLIPGDSLNLPAHIKHRIEWTSAEGPTVWLAVHYAENFERDLERAKNC